MNSPRVPPPMPPGATGPASMPPGATGPASMPPGATGPASNRAASSSLKKAFIKIVFCYVQQNAKGKRGHVYGLGSAQYREQAPSSRVPNGLARNLELEMRVGGLETSLQQTYAQPQVPTPQP
ncbi:hypothetical protein YC2023_071373 [Brassica napus]